MPPRHTLPASTIGSNLPPMVGAVIYVRVSTKEQTENLSLPTQLRACEEYCRRQGYEVLERFHEEGESAKTTDRSQLQAPVEVLPHTQGQDSLRRGVQPHALRAGEVRPLRAPLFFPDGIAFDGSRFNRTAATAPLFKYLESSESADERVVSRGIEPPTRRLRERVVGVRPCPRRWFPSELTPSVSASSADFRAVPFVSVSISVSTG